MQSQVILLRHSDAPSTMHPPEFTRENKKKKTFWHKKSAVMILEPLAGKATLLQPWTRKLYGEGEFRLIKLTELKQRDHFI